MFPNTGGQNPQEVTESRHDLRTAGATKDPPEHAHAGENRVGVDRGLTTLAPARLYTFRAEVYGVVDDVTYLRDPAGLVGLSLPWDGERLGDERTVTVEVRP